MHPIEQAVEWGPRDERDAARREAARIEARFAALRAWPPGDTPEARAEVRWFVDELGRMDNIYRPSACGRTAPFATWIRGAKQELAREAERIIPGAVGMFNLALHDSEPLGAL